MYPELCSCCELYIGCLPNPTPPNFMSGTFFFLTPWSFLKGPFPRQAFPVHKVVTSTCSIVFMALVYIVCLVNKTVSSMRRSACSSLYFLLSEQHLAYSWPPGNSSWRAKCISFKSAWDYLNCVSTWCPSFISFWLSTCCRPVTMP